MSVRKAYGALMTTLVLVSLCWLLWWGFYRTIETIDTEPVRRGHIEDAVAAQGVLQPHRYVDVGAQVSGQIKRIVVQSGGTVRKGELLLEIDPALQQAAVQADRAALDSLRAELAEQQAQRTLDTQQMQRQTRLAELDSTSQEQVQIARANLNKTEARIASLKARIEGAQSTLRGNEALLGYTRIYAPMDGTVVTLEAREGQTLNATYQTPSVLRIADLTRMTVWASVSEADVGRVRAGMPVWFTTLGLRDSQGWPRRWEGTLRQLLPAPPTASTGEGSESTPSSQVVNYTALFDVDNTDGALMPQMSARVFFVSAGARDVLLAPLALLEPAEDETFTVPVLKDGQVQQRPVRIGVRDRLNAEVLSGLEEGEALVTGITTQRGSQRLRW
ncbi:efflux RND transporter periplasmic adaptor subunit [Thauera sp. SDU_THAU2]|uniref:efflux RND transporter periplasmic adaptor subunit n=1 Tax=Thauera sp. SDU_THAU2 TaxID=3136633 RepID=UPI00311D9E1B